MLGINPHYITDAEKIEQDAPEILEQVKQGTLSIPRCSGVRILWAVLSPGYVIVADSGAIIGRKGRTTKAEIGSCVSFDFIGTSVLCWERSRQRRHRKVGSEGSRRPRCEVRSLKGIEGSLYSPP
jgi:hypothetical protein